MGHEPPRRPRSRRGKTASVSGLAGGPEGGQRFDPAPGEGASPMTRLSSGIRGAIEFQGVSCPAGFAGRGRGFGSAPRCRRNAFDSVHARPGARTG